MRPDQYLCTWLRRLCARPEWNHQETEEAYKQRFRVDMAMPILPQHVHALVAAEQLRHVKRQRQLHGNCDDRPATLAEQARRQ